MASARKRQAEAAALKIGMRAWIRQAHHEREAVGALLKDVPERDHRAIRSEGNVARPVLSQSRQYLSVIGLSILVSAFFHRGVQRRIRQRIRDDEPIDPAYAAGSLP